MLLYARVLKYGTKLPMLVLGGRMRLLKFLIDRIFAHRPFYYLWEQRSYERSFDRRYEQREIHNYSAQSTCRFYRD